MPTHKVGGLFLPAQGCDTVTVMTLEELIDKWVDVAESADDWVEKNLAREIVDDLKGLKRG